MAAKDDFTLDDFRRSLEHLKKMGARKDLIRGTPVLSEMILESEEPESAFKRIQRIIDAMTEEERRDTDGIDLNNRQQIAAERVVPRFVYMHGVRGGRMACGRRFLRITILSPDAVRDETRRPVSRPEWPSKRRSAHVSARPPDNNAKERQKPPFAAIPSPVRDKRTTSRKKRPTAGDFPSAGFLYGWRQGIERLMQVRCAGRCDEWHVVLGP